MSANEEEAKRRFRADTVPAFIDLLGMAEEALRGWRKSRGDEEGPEWHDIDIKDLMIAANTMLTMTNTVALREMQAAAAGPKGSPSIALVEGGMVRLDAKKVQAAFAAHLAMRGVVPELSGRVLAELVSTDKGLEMLQVMLMDALRLRQQRGLPRPGGKDPGQLEELEGPHGEA